MSRRTVRFLMATTALAVTTAMTGFAPAAQADPIMVLDGSGPPPIPLKNMAMVKKTSDGLRYMAGQQNSNLTITEVGTKKILFVDPGTQKLKSKPKLCKEQTAAKGIAVLCRIPAKFVDSNEMFLEIWPRLGNDTVDGSTLSAKYRMWVLGDEGDETVFGGAGDDFVNGAQDDDTVHGGGGDDWIRTGIGDDELFGDAGTDKLVGTDDSDTIHGGAGKDSIYCGNGHDAAFSDSSDKVSQCETVNAE